MATVETPAGLGSALRAARRRKSLSLSDVAAATGISPSFLSLVENGKSDITIGRLVRLVTFFAIVAAVNAVMMTAAITTFGGVETGSSYQAGLTFARDNSAVQAQDRLG